MKKRQLSFWEIWNMSFGFLGIQFAFALQNANTSRIFEAYDYKPKADSLLRINDQVGQNVALSISNSIEQKLKSLKDIKGNSHESNLKLSSIRSILQALDTQVD